MISSYVVMKCLIVVGWKKSEVALAIFPDQDIIASFVKIVSIGTELELDRTLPIVQLYCRTARDKVYRICFLYC